MLPEMVLRYLLLLALLVASANALPAFRSFLPNGHNVWRNGVRWGPVGHTSDSSPGSDNLNAFGNALKANAFIWDSVICMADSDDDGYTNGEELGDPYCQWKIGETPNRNYDISHPGFNDSVPVGSLNSTTQQILAALPGLAGVLDVLGSTTNFSMWTWPNPMDGSNVSLCWVNPLFNSTTGGPTYACDFSVFDPPLGGTLNIGMLPSSFSALNVSNQSLVVATTTVGSSPSSLSFTGCPEDLRMLDISGNRFTGPLAPGVANCKSLTYLDASNNRFNGTLLMSDFPASLSRLDVSNNAFAAVNFIGNNLNATAEVILSRGGDSTPFSSTVLFACGQTLPAITVTLSNGVPSSAASPTQHCSACIVGELYDYSKAACSPIGAVNTPPPIMTSTSPQPANTTSAPLSLTTVQLRSDVKNYCDKSCTAAIVLLVLGLVALVIIAVVVKIFCRPLPMETEDGDAPQVDSDAGANQSGGAGDSASAGEGGQNRPPPTAMATDGGDNRND